MNRFNQNIKVRRFQVLRNREGVMHTWVVAEVNGYPVYEHQVTKSPVKASAHLKDFIERSERSEVATGLPNPAVFSPPLSTEHKKG